MSRVSVVIPTVRLGRRLQMSVDTLIADPEVAEVIVVDDRAAPGGGAVIPSGPQVRVIATSGGTGPNAAREAGVDAAIGELILLLDDDVIPTPTLAAAHAAHHVRDTALVIVGYMPVRTGDRGSLGVRLYREDYEKRVADYERDPASVLKNLWGGNVSLRRDDARRVGVAAGGFAGRRHEDRDFGLRCQAAGLHGSFDRSLVAVHHYDRTVAEALRDARDQGRESVALNQKHGVGPVHRPRRAQRIAQAASDPSLAALKLARRLAQARGAWEARHGPVSSPR